MANNVHRHISKCCCLVLVSFVISVLFGEVKMEKIGSFCVTGRRYIAIFSEHKNVLHFFSQTEEDLLLFHKMLEGLLLCFRSADSRTPG